MSQIVISMAEAEDIPALLVLLKQVHAVHAEHRPDIFPGESKYDAEQLKEILTDPSAPVLVARSGGRAVGYVMCRLSSPAFAVSVTRRRSLYIDDLCVDEAMRGRGVGRLLYEAAVSFARGHDCYNLTLNVWEFNEGAVAFYKKMGLLPLKTTMEKIL